MPNAADLLAESRSRIYRNDDWLWWTLASCVNDAEKEWRKKGCQLPESYMIDSSMEEFLRRIDDLEAWEALERKLKADEAHYARHSEEVVESTKAELRSIERMLYPMGR